MHSAPDLEQALDIASGVGVAKVLLDIDRLTFIDGCGISTLLMATRRFATEAVAFRIKRPGGHVARSLRLTGVDTRLPLTEQRDDRGRPLPAADVRRLPSPFGVDFSRQNSGGSMSPAQATSNEIAPT